MVKASTPTQTVAFTQVKSPKTKPQAMALIMIHIVVINILENGNMIYPKVKVRKSFRMEPIIKEILKRDSKMAMDIMFVILEFIRDTFKTVISKEKVTLPMLIIDSILENGKMDLFKVLAYFNGPMEIAMKGNILMGSNMAKVFFILRMVKFSKDIGKMDKSMGLAN